MKSVKICNSIESTRIISAYLYGEIPYVALVLKISRKEAAQRVIALMRRCPKKFFSGRSAPGRQKLSFLIHSKRGIQKDLKILNLLSKQRILA